MNKEKVINLIALISVFIFLVLQIMQMIYEFNKIYGLIQIMVGVVYLIITARRLIIEGPKGGQKK